MKVDIEREEISTLLLVLDIVTKQYENVPAQRTLVRDCQEMYKKLFDLASRK